MHKITYSESSDRVLAQFNGEEVFIEVHPYCKTPTLHEASAMERLGKFLVECAHQKHKKDRQRKAGPKPLNTPHLRIVNSGYYGISASFQDEPLSAQTLETASKMRNWCDIMNGDRD